MEIINKILKYIDHEWVKGVLINHLSTIIAFSLGFVISWVRRNIYFYLKLKRLILSVFRKKKYILIWNDDNKVLSENISNLLSLKFAQNNDSFLIKTLEKPEELLFYPVRSNLITAIILIVTDVTKLSEIEEERNKIQTHLVDFVKNGGILIGTHDIIYRRTRNEKLQEIFGCQSNNFIRFNNSSINVEINGKYSKHPLLEGLPNNFNLSDGEICWGEWSHDADLLISTTKKFKPNSNIDTVSKKVPMLVIRKFPNKGKVGLTIWLNSCDKFERLADSLNPPQFEIIQIFSNAVLKKEEIKSYQRELL
ncbi:MAG TPA: hypothetical protein VK175_14605 [Leadbetterella sp.]|nr:hypothetical protein [Leadbetterella sp.]